MLGPFDAESKGSHQWKAYGDFGIEGLFQYRGAICHPGCVSFVSRSLGEGLTSVRLVTFIYPGCVGPCSAIALLSFRSKLSDLIVKS